MEKKGLGKAGLELSRHRFLSFFLSFFLSSFTETVTTSIGHT